MLRIFKIYGLRSRRTKDLHCRPFVNSRNQGSTLGTPYQLQRNCQCTAHRGRQCRFELRTPGAYLTEKIK